VLGGGGAVLIRGRLTAIALHPLLHLRGIRACLQRRDAEPAQRPRVHRRPGQVEIVDPASVRHVRAFTAPGQVLGLSPIQHARPAIGLGLGAERYAAKFFGESAIPSGVLTSDQDIKPDRADQLKARWRERHQGNRDIAVLGSGARFQAVTVPPEEAQFLETTRANIATICRYCNVPPELVGGESGGSLTYANVEQRGAGLPHLLPPPLAGPVGGRPVGAAVEHDQREVQRRRPGPHRPAHPLPGPRERHPGRLEAAV
jgi:phage portal protein BeeE